MLLRTAIVNGGAFLVRLASARSKSVAKMQAKVRELTDRRRLRTKEDSCISLPATSLCTARKLGKPPCTERYARWCERTVGEIIAYLLLDC